MSLFLAAFHNGLDINFNQFVVLGVKNVKIPVYFDFRDFFNFSRATKIPFATHSLENAVLEV